MPIERGLVAALEEIDVHELIFGMQAMSHEDGHFTTEPAASETNPVVSSIQQLQFETAAMTSDVQSRLVIGIVFGELLIGLYETFRLSKPVLMALAI